MQEYGKDDDDNDDDDDDDNKHFRESSSMIRFKGLLNGRSATNRNSAPQEGNVGQWKCTQ